MAVREKVALFSIIIVVFAIKYANSLPKSMAKRARPGVKPVFNSTPAPWTKQKSSRHQISKTNQRDVFEKFNFPEIEYPSASTPNTPLYFHDIENKFTDTALKGTQPKRKVEKQRRNRKFNKSVQGNLKGAEFSSAPSYRDVGTFPDVEYPLNNKDVWRPNYWNCPPKIFQPSNITKSRRRGIHSSTKSTVKSKNNQAIPKRLSNLNRTNRNHPGVREDNTGVELPTKKRSHDVLPSHEPLFDYSYTATPTPDPSPEISALRTKLASNIAQRAISLIKDKVNSKTSTEPTLALINDHDLEEILFNPRNFNSHSLIDSIKVNETPVNVDTYNTTEPAINMFTAITESPELHKLNQTNTFGTDNTNLLPLNDINIDSLSPRGPHNDPNRSIVEHSVGVIDKSVNNETITDKPNNDSDEDYTTDDPTDNYVLSTISPIDNWRNTDIIDPYKSVSYPDDLEEYFIAVK
ncbi:uncharacterized protein LOC123690294 [Pieris rapae]|uniref:uncharacterized protein LOC123690294 n=1 Tax=Pieris rapae TaxID=64459 RepID=UPI001E27A9BE|nr:uncharacterized protein LOC123690294 [Pieris rapae]